MELNRRLRVVNCVTGRIPPRDRDKRVDPEGPEPFRSNGIVSPSLLLLFFLPLLLPLQSASLMSVFAVLHFRKTRGSTSP